MIDPPRVIVDIRGEPGSNLRQTTEVDDGNVREIRLEKGNTQTLTTRLVVGLERAVDYEVVEQDNIITLTLRPEELPLGSPQPLETKVAMESQEAEEVEKAGVAAAEPRVFFKPRPIGMNQVLGVDFAMLDGGRSLLVVTTDMKVSYHLERKGPKILVLTLEESTIPPLLMRRLDSRYFEGTVDRVKASVTDSQVILAILLREMVPFHVKQTDAGISVDFAPTVVRPPEKRLVPLKVTEAQAVEVVSPVQPSLPEVAVVRAGLTPTVAPRPGTGAPQKAYTGEPMYLDFVNAEVTNILRLINEVSKENIIWDPAIAGRTVSMVLKDVPWDQALDLILVNNDLAKKRVAPNILWITTRDKLAKIEADERRKQQEYEARIDAERKRKLEEKEKKKALEPLITEFIGIDFATADEIKQHIVLSDRGSITTDARTNMIIIKDIAESVEEAKKIIKQFDTPVKQIMIEARIVDASTTFGRDLGLVWDPETTAWRRSQNVEVTVPPNALSTSGEEGFTSPGLRVWGGSFTTNVPSASWVGNIGLHFAKLTSSGMGALTLDARLALAESEGKAKTLSAPKVIASNGESATISRGTTFYLEAAENVEAKEVTAMLSLDVTPTVSYNDFVTMEVNVKDETASGKTKSGKDLTTKLMVKSGETIVIGGIYKEDSSETETGFPYLRNIPILGWLFKARTNTLTRSELLIFLTPTVLPPPGKAQAGL